MNRRLNILIVTNNNDYNNKVAADLIRYYTDINKVFIIKNYNELLQQLESNNIHILVLYLNMKCNKKILQYLKEQKYLTRVHIIGVYENEIELSCSYINDFDILLNEIEDFKLFSFQLFNSYTHNTNKYKNIELISESEKLQEHSKQLYELQQSLLKSLHDEQCIAEYQKLIDRLFEQIVIPHKNISYEILNKALMITCMLKESDIKLETIIYVLIAEFNMEDKQIKRHLRLAITDIFDIVENLYFLANIFPPSDSIPSTKDFLITLKDYINNKK